MNAAVPLNPDASMSFDLIMKWWETEEKLWLLYNIHHPKPTTPHVSIGSKPEQIGSPDDGQVPCMHVGLRRM